MIHNPFVIHAQNRMEVEEELACQGVKPADRERFADAGEPLQIHVERLAFEEAALLRKEMQLLGGDAVMHDNPALPDLTDLYMKGTYGQWQALLERIPDQTDGLRVAAAEVRELLAMRRQLRQRKAIHCKSHVLPLGQKTLVMGILNVTPDSFSDGGRYTDIERAIAQARALVEAGADIIDIGGESTRPGSAPVELAEELDRVIPVVRALVEELSVPLSVDTYKSEVAEQAIRAGAHIINDVWGAKKDRRIAEVAAQHEVPIILMHNREDTAYTHFFSDMVRDLRKSVAIAREAGVRDEMIILDPGIGFAKSLEQNLEAMRRLDDLVALGYPVLLGTSRKSMIGRVLDLPVEERLEGTAATVALGVAKGCQIVRVHDVKEMKRVTAMMDAMLKGGGLIG
ncbi:MULTISPECIES: dihydropteroate synthase [Brevibacillus]|jgi:dihydropteroate synthase|uniref:dihydropteroate synthase n=1 Tax=Brevibacillus TaxID=55080 RepID=UPI00116C0DD6|nr:dihydropteroate synthase [Brevibacillus borstelensis]MCC0566047.1 dihydropteroate synthase [Brevibacillus borstelensis]MCM3560847.1 dihydropteroate synthase [Brevibacillus borstelensis]MCM3624563.1 dihydropteroate synthase [Brevibacillus borstelensis]MED1852968.1 dihydropteroate synthase [Brevibacillus borstelensis]MED1885586.1 dihydropteroate synthase [Brevibacillus borstelensis]